MLNLILAWRALQPLIVRTKGPKTFAEAIAVETVVQRFMDGDETQEDDQADKVELSQGRKEVLSFAAVEHDDDLEKKERIGNDHPFNFAAVPPMNTAQAY